ncbi:hypothetical protein QYF36_016261 [Acer negundo]|nr:hypothetical protein QYF36_016261 [Acer negundo]
MSGLTNPTYLELELELNNIVEPILGGNCIRQIRLVTNSLARNKQRIGRQNIKTRQSSAITSRAETNFSISLTEEADQTEFLVCSCLSTGNCKSLFFFAHLAELKVLEELKHP